MAYEDFKDLPRKTAPDKVLGDKIFNIARNTKCNAYQRLQWFIVLFKISYFVVVLKVRLCQTSN